MYAAENNIPVEYINTTTTSNDFDGDGQLSENDVAAMQDILMNGGNADINGDGVTDILDLLYLQKMIAG